MTTNAKDTPCETLQCEDEGEEDQQVPLDLKNEETAAFEEHNDNENNQVESANRRQSLPYFISESANSSGIDEKQMECDIILKSENLYRSPFHEERDSQCAPPVKAIHRDQASEGKASVYVSFKKQSGGPRASRRSPERPSTKKTIPSKTQKKK